MSWYKQGLQVTIGLMSDCFQSQTNVISSNIVLSISSQVRPIVYPADQLSCLVNAEMPCKRVVVVMIYHFKVDDLWDIWKPSVLKHSLNVLLVLRKALSSQYFCLFIIVLQLGES